MLKGLFALNTEPSELILSSSHCRVFSALWLRTRLEVESLGNLSVGCRKVMIALLLQFVLFYCLQAATLNIPISLLYSRRYHICFIRPPHTLQSCVNSHGGLTVVQHVLLNSLYFLAVALPYLCIRKSAHGFLLSSTSLNRNQNECHAGTACSGAFCPLDGTITIKTESVCEQVTVDGYQRRRVLYTSTAGSCGNYFDS